MRKHYPVDHRINRAPDNNSNYILTVEEKIRLGVPWKAREKKIVRDQWETILFVGIYYAILLYYTFAHVCHSDKTRRKKTKEKNSHC